MGKAQFFLSESAQSRTDVASGNDECCAGANGPFRRGTVTQRLLVATALATVVAGIPIALGLRSGSGPGFNGGAAGSGFTCAVCHGFNIGSGFVEILDAPRRYRPGMVYDLTVRIEAPEEDGAGFELSAERNGRFCVGGDNDGASCSFASNCPGGKCTNHTGTFVLQDSLRTQFASGAHNYVTSTLDGVDDSVSTWAANGQSVEFQVQWQAPNADAGPVTLFAAANALLDGPSFTFVDTRYYANHTTFQFARDSDADGDLDVDLRDFATLQRCFSDMDLLTGLECTYVDADGDGAVSLVDVALAVDTLVGPVATLPPAYVLADSVRGGLMYDRWWKETRVPQPVGDHPLYPAIGLKAGAATFRCKECHGWDYRGADGAYGSGSHFTGIVGVAGTSRTPQELFDLLTADPNVVPGGHDMDAFGMSERDIWDVIKMVREDVMFTCSGGLDAGRLCRTDVECDGGICDGNTAVAGNPAVGQGWFDNLCQSCHGLDGQELNFGTVGDPEYLGTVANSNAPEFLHVVRFGHAGFPMPSFQLVGFDKQVFADILTYAATLPQ